MDNTLCPKLAGEYFDFSTPELQDNTPFAPYNSEFSPYDLSLPSPDSCDSILPSPISPSLNYPAYTLLSTETTSKSDPLFNFGTLDDWMGWDEVDPANKALSPTSDFFPELKMEPVSPAVTRLNLQPPATPRSEVPLFKSSSSFATPPISDLGRENLYSTPLSWSQPSVGISPQHFTRLSATEESQLRSIAMPQLTSILRPPQYSKSPSSTSSLEPVSIRRKRKSVVEEGDIDEDSDEEMEALSKRGSGKPVKKMAHNMIEKRYRTNLNDKIAALRDSVPSLRVVTRKGTKEQNGEEDLQGLTPAHKLNKATVLAKATEYIAHLEQRNRTVYKENGVLKSRVVAFEILMNSRQPQKSDSISRGTVSRQQSRPTFDTMLN